VIGVGELILIGLHVWGRCGTGRCGNLCVRFMRQTGLGLWRRSLLRVEGELALPLICDDLLAGSSLL
jgi:hypothetical protein